LPINADPGLVQAFTGAAAMDGERMKVGGYKWTEGYGAIYCKDTVLQDFLTDGAGVIIKPRWRGGKAPPGAMHDVDAFDLKTTPTGPSILFDIYTIPAHPDTPPQKQADQARFNVKTRRFTHGHYGGPLKDLRPLRGHCDRTALAIIHWVKQHVRGFQDLFLLDKGTVDQHRAMAQPPPIERKDLSNEDLAIEEAAQGRPISDPDLSNAHVRQPRKSAVELGAHDESGRGAVSRVRVKLEVRPEAVHFEYDGPPSLEQLREQLNEVLTQAILLRRVPMEPLSTEELLPKNRVLQAFEAHGMAHEGGVLVSRDDILREASDGTIEAGFADYNRAVKHLDRIIDNMNAGRYPTNPAPPTPFTITKEERRIVNGRATEGKRPTRLAIFYRLQPRTNGAPLRANPTIETEQQP
jgi:hypothetical protein